MKAALWFILMIISATISLYAQEMNKTIVDSKLDKEVLIGYCNRAGLQDGDFGEFYKQEYEGYTPNKKYVNRIGDMNGSVDIVLVLGTWCHDSQEQVPRFYRILDEAAFSDDVMKVICVDGNKTGGELSIEHLGIARVPTFIFYRDGEEIGRIIETPKATLEKDMWKIIH